MILYARYSHGFTLLELAIVLFILALLLGGLLVPLAMQQSQAEIEETESRLNEIREALYGFVYQNRRLPCPDTDDPRDGEENIDASGDCAGLTGALPWATLAVNGLDAWGNEFTYRVAAEYADDNPGATCVDPSGDVPPCVSFDLASTGDIDVKEDPADTTYVARGIPVIVISHGGNFSLGEPSAFEQENLDGETNELYIDRDFSQQDGNEFDDQLIWLSPHVLRSKMVQIGFLP